MGMSFLLCDSTAHNNMFNFSNIAKVFTGENNVIVSGSNIVNSVINGVSYCGEEELFLSGMLALGDDNYKNIKLKIPSCEQSLLKKIMLEGNCDEIKSTSGSVKITGDTGNATSTSGNVFVALDVNSANTTSGDIFVQQNVNRNVSTVSGDITYGTCNGCKTSVSGRIC